MIRMGFGLCIAPKFMDIIVRWVTRNFQAVDKYVDDMMMPECDTDAVVARLAD